MGLNPNSVYYWRVRSANGSQQGFYSAKFSFTTGTSTGISETNNDFLLLSLFPNPATKFIYVQIDNPSARNLQFKITDLTGRNTAVEIFPSDEKAFTKSLYVDDLAPGMYLLTISSDAGYITRKIMIR
jgi:hypothetical protein